MSFVVSGALVAAWESEYRRYGQAAELSLWAGGDPGDASAMADASASVAVAWRRIAGSTVLPWWLLAAVDSAAQAFEAQAQEWQAREAGTSADWRGTWES